MKNYLPASIIFVSLIIIIGIFSPKFVHAPEKGSGDGVTPQTATSVPPSADQATSTTPDSISTTPSPVVSPKVFLPYGTVLLRPGETATFAHAALTLIRVADDSRCAQGVNCIWAGTLHAEIRLKTDTNTTSTETIELGKSLTTKTETITLSSAAPYPQAGKKIAQEDYQLTFQVTRRAQGTTPSPKPEPPIKEACYTGGCSGEICADRPDVISTCIYRAEYACYKKSLCERQASGACGWTETPEFRSCLNNPPQM